ncbi:MAG: DUF1615 family protein [Myxococcota bacterium]
MVWLWGAMLGWFGCVVRPSAPDPGLPLDAIEALVRPDVKDRAGWAGDVRSGLLTAGMTPDASNVCQVLAVIEQESGYAADPAVPGLGRIARAEIEAKLSPLGPLSGLGADWLLSAKPEGQTKTFGERLDAAKTERDLDRLFREILAYHEGQVPGLQQAGATLFSGRLERLNPVRTAGSMQVGVDFAQELGRAEGVPAETVRELLYTRAGGVRYGTARLFAYRADYDDVVYRFADYNAGLYASRNAAFQTQLAAITGLDLAPDGDLLVYTDAGNVRDGQTMGALLAWRAASAPDLTEAQLRREVRREKTAAFEQTETWTRVRAQYTAKTGKSPAYARLPDVALDSPKMTKQRTTAWFAQSVDKRYEACIARGRK